MPLTELKALIEESYKPNYYTLLLKNHKEILLAVKNTSQKQVALDIDMKEPKFSVVYNLLLAYADEKAREV